MLSMQLNLVIMLRFLSNLHCNSSDRTLHHPQNPIAYNCLASFELELVNIDLFYDLEIKYASIP